MKKIFLEIIAILLVFAVSGTVVYRVFPQIISNIEKRNEKELPGRIEKVPLKVSSPTYALIDKLPVQIGQLVKKGDTLAVLKDISDNEKEIDINSSLFQKDENNMITVFAPTDGIVAEIYFSENSTVKPQLDVLSLYPFDTTRVRFSSDKEIVDNDAMVTIRFEGQTLELNLLDTLPTKLIGDESYVYYASFKNPMSSLLFYDNQRVDILVSDESKK